MDLAPGPQFADPCSWTPVVCNEFGVVLGWGITPGCEAPPSPLPAPSLGAQLIWFIGLLAGGRSERSVLARPGLSHGARAHRCFRTTQGPQTYRPGCVVSPSLPVPSRCPSAPAPPPSPFLPSSPTFLSPFLHSSFFASI